MGLPAFLAASGDRRRVRVGMARDYGVNQYEPRGIVGGPGEGTKAAACECGTAGESAVRPAVPTLITTRCYLRIPLFGPCPSGFSRPLWIRGRRFDPSSSPSAS